MSPHALRIWRVLLMAILATVPGFVGHAQGTAVGGDVASVRLMFGLKRQTPTRWDGEIRVSSGRVVKIDGVHFEGRDTIEGTSSWLLTTRVTRYGDSTTARGYDPVHTRPYAMIPNGVVATLDAPPDATVNVETEAGRFSFKIGELGFGSPIEFLDGEASAELLPATLGLTSQDGYNDYPALTVGGNGQAWASWISYAGRKDTVWLARHNGSGWGSPVRVTPRGYEDNFRTRVATDRAGRIWVVWTGKRDGRWGLHARFLEDGDLSEVTTLADGRSGPNLYHDAVADSEGRLHVVWQGFRGQVSRILHRTWDGSRWSSENSISSGPADNWAPAAAADSKGNVWVGWDGYEDGDFNVYVRRISASGELGEIRQITKSPAFDANASLACDGRGRLWIAWDHGEANWGKDWTSQRFKPGGGAGLYRTRSVRLAVFDGKKLRQPATPIMDAIPREYKDYLQQARLQPDADGRIWVMGRSLTSFTTRVNNNWGAGGIWEVIMTRLDSDGWMPAVKLHGTNGRNDVWSSSTEGDDGKLWFAWSRDDRPFGGKTPIERRNPLARVTNVSYTVIDPSATRSAGEIRLVPFQEANIAVQPVHENESEDVRAIREYRVEAGGKSYRILRGDLHRHTDISGDGIGDGGLIDFYRYALTAGQYDFMMVGDHQYGGGRDGLEYNWWRTEKSEDIYLVPDRFWPLFGTERSVAFPNGHRNTVFAKRGVRELPIPRDERSGKTNTGSLLYPYLRKNGGITTPHSLATDQGTDWRDYDPELEPIVELYQGLHSSYEYPGAPRAATEDKRYYHHGAAWRPEGFVWEAWAKGLKLGLQASADHIATHDAYGCVLVEAGEMDERQDLIDAMKARHTYAATDNIILDVRIGEHIMGDAFETTERPVLRVQAIGTRAIGKVVLIKNNQFIHTTEPGTKEVDFEYRDATAKKGDGESYYYVRIEQSDGSLAWSSPIWVTYR
jgi:hypothetical protein